jgi:protein phosphatase
MSELSLRFSSRSEIGIVRRNNEDSGFASNNLLVVADGMGGHEAGELASAATVAAIVDAVENSSNVEQVLELLANAVITSGEYIADVVASNREYAGMGTTLTALALREDRVAIAHVGDSRAYLLRDGELQQLTKDHTFVQTLVDSGEITKEQAAVHPRRNLMMRAIDGIHAVEVDLQVREARVGDRFMLCSDGVCGIIDEAKILEVLGNTDPTMAVTSIIDAVIDAGAPDNITVVVADVMDDVVDTDPVVVGAAADTGNHERLPGIEFPDEAQLVVSETPLYLAPQRHWLRTSLITLVVVGLGFFGATLWLSNQWFVGAIPQTGYIGIYQGVPSGGLNRLIEPSMTRVVQLPDFERAQVQATLNASTHADAQATLDRLNARAAACVADPTIPGCPAVAK